MFLCKQIQRFAALSVLALVATGGVSAKSRKGEKFFQQGQKAEVRNEWDQALAAYEQALNADPGDAGYILAVRKARFQAGQRHVDQGQKLRSQGKLEEALAEFQKAYSTDPGSAIAEQEYRRTRAMIEAEKQRQTQPGAAVEKPEDRGLTPQQRAKKESDSRFARAMDAPELRPISRNLNNLKMNNQPITVMFETVGKLAGLNVVFDPDVKSSAQGKNFTVDFTNSTLEEALDYLAVLSHSYWKPLSSNTIFVTQDNPTKRREYEDLVLKVFYLQNMTTPQELQEVVSALRVIADLRRIFTYNAQNAIMIRGTTDQVALCEKLINDLDKPKPEVLVDFVVMEANKEHTRDLAATLQSGGTNGLSVPIGFTPRNPVLYGGTPTPSTPTNSTDANGNPISNNNNGGSASNPSGSGGTITGQSTGISLARVGRISTNDFSLTLPGALFSLVVKDSQTRILQSPQIRASDGKKATLKIGDKVPIATGSFQPGVGTVGVSPLVSTQFNFQDVGVNVDIEPHVHGPDEVTLHIEIEISTVKDRINVGGLSQPIIGQRRIVHDVRLKEGEVNLIAGLEQLQDSINNSGIPGLQKIPFLRMLLGSDSTDKSRGELLIAVIPHIIRTPELNTNNMKELYVGNDTNIALRITPPTSQVAAPASPVAPAQPQGGILPPGVPNPNQSTPPTPAPSTSPASPPKLSFLPPTPQVHQGGMFEVGVRVDGVTDLFDAPMKFKFDNRILRLNDIRIGDFLTGDGQKANFSQSILNETGEVSVKLNRLPGSAGISGSGILVVMRFEAIGKGATTIAMPEVSLRTSQMQAIPIQAPSASVTVQ